MSDHRLLLGPEQQGRTRQHEEQEGEPGQASPIHTAWAPLDRPLPQGRQRHGEQSEPEAGQPQDADPAAGERQASEAPLARRRIRGQEMLGGNRDRPR